MAHEHLGLVSLLARLLACSLARLLLYVLVWLARSCAPLLVRDLLACGLACSGARLQV